MLFPCTERDQALTAAGVAGMSPYYEAALPSANSVASIIPALTAYANAAMPHLAHLGPITFGPPLAQAARQVRPLCQFTNCCPLLAWPQAMDRPASCQFQAWNYVIVRPAEAGSGMGACENG